DKPDIRFKNIHGLLEALNLHGNASRNEFLKAFGVTISTLPKTVEGFRRQAPQISYGGKKTCLIDKAKYNWRERFDIRYVEGGKVDRMIIVLSDRRLPEIIREPLERTISSKGIQCGNIEFVLVNCRDSSETECRLEEVFKQNKASKESLLIIYVDKAENKSHEFLKLMEVKYLIPTQQLTTELAYNLPR
ncbi:hypothetical protein OSTOST_14857, partial [Ostertagia ostertagi]